METDDDITANESNSNPTIGKQSLTMDTSPSHITKDETNSPSPQRSPTKQLGNLLNTDPAATLAAISARLAILLPPAESEIVRIHREALATMRTHPTGSKSPGARMDSNANDSNSIPHSSPSSKSSITPAFYDSVIAEEWINLHLEMSGSFLLPASNIATLMKIPCTDDDEFDAGLEAFAFRKNGDGGPLSRAGIDRFSLYRMGMPKDLVDRLYRALYVYTNGFHNLISEIAAHCPPQIESHVLSNAWLTFLLLLEQCENGKYEMAMFQFKQAAQTAQKQLQDGFRQEKLDLDTRLHLAEAALSQETTRGVEKSELLQKLTAETTDSKSKIAKLEQENETQAEEIRLLKLELLVSEDEQRKLTDRLDDVRRDYDVTNSERLNALSECLALKEEIQKLSLQLERIGAEKANYARRMHETLFMNQALRASNDQFKHEIAALKVEKHKMIAENQTLQEQVGHAQTEISNLHKLKAQIKKELDENRCEQRHLETRLQTLKEQLGTEAEKSGRYQQEIGRLTTQVGVLEANCSLLLIEKQNPGIRAQDKLRIEQLCSEKIELEAIVEANALDRKNDEEQISSLRLSLEAVGNELQHNKRVYSSAQQAFLHSERTCEQLRQQAHELERHYDKAKKNVLTLEERFKMYEKTAKNQIARMETEVKAVNAQLREATDITRDDAAQIEQLTKTLSLAEKEATVLKTCIAGSKEQVAKLQTENDALQRIQMELELASSTSKNTLRRYILSLQKMLTLVKLDEFPLEEALRELLEMLEGIFGEQLKLDQLLCEDDVLVETEVEVHEDVADEERASQQRRAQVHFQEVGDAEGLQSADGNEENQATHTSVTFAAAISVQREVVRMSRFRKSKLDHLVTKLQRDLATKADLITNLESEHCDLTATTRQQAHLIVQHKCLNGMLCSDLEMTTLMLFESRAEKHAMKVMLEQARIDQALQTDQTLETKRAFVALQQEFDIQVMKNEDLMAKIWHKYEHDLHMWSLRRHKEVQAIATVMDQSSQTFNTQRNAALERSRVASTNIPGSSETLLHKISRATRALLPGVANEMDLYVVVERVRQQRNHKQSLVSPIASNSRSSSIQEGSERRRRGTCHNEAPSSTNDDTSTLPQLEGKSDDLSPAQRSHHGVPQESFMPSTRPQFISEQGSTSTTLSPRPPASSSRIGHKLMPRKVKTDKRLELDEARVESSEANITPSDCSSTALPTPPHHPSSPRISVTTNVNTLRPNRSFLRVGMEVLRNADANQRDGNSIQSSSRLAAAVSQYHHDRISLQEAAWRTQVDLPSNRRFVSVTNGDEQPAETDEKIPAVLYPILPNQ